MSDSGYSLGQVLGLDRAGIEEAVVGHLRSFPVAAPFAPVYGFISEKVAEGVAAKLDVDLIDALIDAFATIKELRRYADPEKVASPEEAALHYGEQRVQLEKQIDVDIDLDALSLPAFQLTLELAAVFKTVALYVRAGQVVALGLGPAYAEATLKHGKKTVAGPVKSAELGFKKRLTLTPPLAIARGAK